MDNLCKSCSGLLSDFNEEDIIAEGFCPHCVDKQGKLKSYKDILDGMIEYIEEDHPEISEDKKLDQAVTWLREGPIWGEKFVGSATMQALEEAHLREIVEVLPSNPAEDIVKIVFYRTELDTVLEALKSRLVSELAWVKFTGNEKTYVIFRDKLLVGSLKNNVFINKVQNYAKSLGLNDNLILLNK